MPRGRPRRANLVPVEPPVAPYPQPNVQERFRKQNPPTFDGMGEPMDAEKWIRALERIFNYIDCEDEDKFTCATYQLVDEADFWWESVKRILTPEQWEAFTWEDFKAQLYEKYIPECYRQKKQNEFWNLKQEKGTVTEYDRLFNQLSRYAPRLVDTDEKRANKFRKGLRPEIAVSLASQGVLSYAQSLSRALNIESLLPQEKGKVSNQAPTQERGKGKRKCEDNNEENIEIKFWKGEPQQQQQGQKPNCQQCQKRHFGECRKGSNACYRCGEIGHYARQCPIVGGKLGYQYQGGANN